MTNDFEITNKTMELSDCRDAWFFDEKYNAWCLEDILYTDKALVPKFQRLSIYVPGEYMDEPGVVNQDGERNGYTARTAPVIFQNNSAGYMTMPHMWLGGPRCGGEGFLAQGYVYVTPGNRGHESKDEKGNWVGKSPWNLIDLKTALRFLRHNREHLPGDFGHIISEGWSAGGAMSALLGATGDHPIFDPYLEENGAFMDESDTVFAAQAYCPISDLEHADLAYEWMFRKDKENESSPAGPHGVMTSFQEALSEKLSEEYIRYFNSLGLRHPQTGEALQLSGDGRGGTAYGYLMDKLGASATKFLQKLSNGEIGDAAYSVGDYLEGNYTYMAPAEPKEPEEKGGGAGLMAGHAGPGVALRKGPGGPEGEPGGEPPMLGEMLSRPPKGEEYHGFEPPMEERRGMDKRGWLSWDGTNARIKDLDSYVLSHRRRMKPCTSFDGLDRPTGENKVFGSNKTPAMHFDEEVAGAVAALKERFPEEYGRYYEAYAAAAGDEELKLRKYLINPLNFIGTKEDRSATRHYRIRVGASDADTSFSSSMTLAVKLMNAGKDASYELVWDKPHCEADYPGELYAWIDQLCRE